ncbi:hypothetical protein [Streptomyces sp. B6B3]|uniref:effector-associated constant component EACC1 n=1 Tax=Streptomyces sp. B6B3 TaxID=3153570 RepID=UPI00325E719F
MGETRIVVAGDSSGQELRSLHAWLVRDGALRGRVRAQRAPAALLVSLARGGVATILSAALIAWLRERTDELRVTLIPDGDRPAVTLSARELRTLDLPQLDQRVASLASRLST